MTIRIEYRDGFYDGLMRRPARVSAWREWAYDAGYAAGLRTNLPCSVTGRNIESNAWHKLCLEMCIGFGDTDE